MPPRPSDDRLARECLEFVADVGYLFDPWQEFQFEQSLLVDAETPNLTWLCTEYGFLTPRQNGKGGVYTGRSISDLFYLPCYDHYGKRKPRLVVYTAHQFKTATEAFQRLADVIDGSDTLRRMVKGVRNSATDKGVDLKNGNRLRYLARSRGGSGRGWSIDSLFTDETQEMPRTAWDALKYTQRAMPNPQRLLTGTVPEPENNSEVWTETRDRGRKRRSYTSGWSEYSPDPDDEQTKFDMTKPAAYGHEVDPDLKYALATNPAFGIRITPKQLLDDADGNAESYKREVLCWWPETGGSETVLRNWADLRDSNSALQQVAFGVQYAWDLTWASIVAAGPRADGLVGVEMIDYRPGVDWAPERLDELNDRWSPSVIVLDVGGPTSLLATTVADLGFDLPMYPIKMAELATACYRVTDYVKNRVIRYRRHAALDAAAVKAKWRNMGQMRAFENRLEGVETSPLLGMTLAIWGATAEVVVPEKDKQTRTKQGSTRVYGFA